MNFWQSFWQHWRKDLSLRLLALAAAVALWLYASSEPVLERKTVIVKTIPVTQNAGRDLRISQLPYVTARIVGGESGLNKLKTDELLYVDLTGLDAGYHLVKVRSKIPSGLRVESLNPSQIQVRLSQLAKRRVAVKLEVPNRFASQTEVSPKTVTVSGGADDVRSVSLVIARAEAESGTAAVMAVDAQGSAVPVKIYPSSVRYRVELAEPVVSKTVPVAKTTGVTFTPAQVRLWGRADALNKIQEVLTEPLPEERQGEVAIVAPPGVYAVEPESVTLAVD